MFKAEKYLDAKSGVERWKWHDPMRNASLRWGKNIPGGPAEIFLLDWEDRMIPLYAHYHATRDDQTGKQTAIWTIQDLGGETHGIVSFPRYRFADDTEKHHALELAADALLAHGNGFAGTGEAMRAAGHTVLVRYKNLEFRFSDI